ncbi:hypothetical protein, partial [Cohnella sp. GbtcB17]|uniref:hypothetical protein n=1 Tax=Cohnella sp. GbtcB17 TaxID=2824762 RepID=UPI001C301662
MYFEKRGCAVGGRCVKLLLVPFATHDKYSSEQLMKDSKFRMVEKSVAKCREVMIRSNSCLGNEADKQRQDCSLKTEHRALKQTDAEASGPKR